jgi:hypothetical protein
VLNFNPNLFVNQLGFLIGSPDTYNQLTITSTAGTFNFSRRALAFLVTATRTCPNM